MVGPGGRRGGAGVGDGRVRVGARRGRPVAPGPAGSAGTEAPGAAPSAPHPTGTAAAEPVPEDCETSAAYPKRQMRGVWIATVRNIDWPSKPGLSVREQQEELTAQLDRAVELGLNAVFFHVRPTADAVYASELEPWARYLTGRQGGDPGYDPLEFAVAQAHERGLELHAWFNPYRVGRQEADLDHLVDDHPVRRHPDWLITYDGQGYLDPGNPEAREWVVDVVADVVERYDVDGVHFDDYFYPYPAQGEAFDDDASWQAHGDGFADRAAWRRDNVNQLIRQVHERVEQTKPWVRFGVSPFGIWRNRSSDPSGSDTSGLQSYDALHADTRAWIREGWIDYVVPQLYWPQGFAAADYAELAPWWAEEVAGTGVDLYIGQAAYRVGEDGWKGADALSRQLDFNTAHPEITGDVYFSMKDLDGRARQAVERVAADHYTRPALPPVADDAQGAPAPVAGLTAEADAEGVTLSWTGADDARAYAVYRVPADADACALADAEHLVAVVGGGRDSYRDAHTGSGAVRYHVTVLDAFRVESAPGEGVVVDRG
ncbi:glycoside hydrolase family 10 protein [Thermobifida cellulosilytica]|uniref:glycoside hydrolase family 10 protein n=1 Tax=Thermobifida cellulosilytica TaxID=144786 RepID=UPI000A77C8ED